MLISSPMKHTLSNIFKKNRSLILFSLCGILSAEAATEKKDSDKLFYRFKDSRGVNVVSSSIPPELVRNGYEIMSINGDVIKSVPASPSDSDADRVARERKAAKEQDRNDKLLRTSYSTTADIDAAKVRRLQQLRDNIGILQANLLSIKSQTKDQETNAANIERAGRKVPDDVLNNINALHAQEKDVNAQIQQREVEYQAAADKFEQDKKRFLVLKQKDAQ